MEELFFEIVNLSVSASWLVLAVLVVRFAFRRAPRGFFCVLWALVALRLVCPLSVESPWSLVPSARTVPKDIMRAETPQIQSGVGPVDRAVNSALSSLTGERSKTEPGAVGGTGANITENEFENGMIGAYGSGSSAGDKMEVGGGSGASITGNVSENGMIGAYGSGSSAGDKMEVWAGICTCVWLAGVAAMVFYALVSYLLLRRRLATATLFRRGIKQSEQVVSPFVLGFLRPVIYLPYKVGEEDLPYVISHEQTHIRRGDHWWKLFGFLLLSVYWFDPLLWAAYILLGRDIEEACDERVIRELGEEERRAYSTALLNCSVRRRRIAACPLAFGETDVKSRIGHVMNYRKPTFWILVAAVLVCAAVAICFLTSPKAEKTGGTPVENLIDGKGDQRPRPKLDAKLSEAIEKAVLSQYWDLSFDHARHLEAHAVLAVERVKNENIEGIRENVTVYAVAVYAEFQYSARLANIFQHCSLVKLGFELRDDGEYYLKRYWTPGVRAEEEIRRQFPEDIIEDALNAAQYEDILMQELYGLFVEYEIFDAEDQCELLIDLILSPPEADNARGCADAHPQEYRDLLYYGTYAMDYCEGQLSASRGRGGEKTPDERLREEFLEMAVADIGEILSRKDSLYRWE